MVAGKYLVAAIAFLIASCSSKEDVDSISGTRHEIKCHGWINQCYYRAQDRCKHRGYHVKSTNSLIVKGGPYQQQKQFLVYIECK